MQQPPCPKCGSREVHCRNYVQSPTKSLVPAWLWSRSAAVGLSVCSLFAICINVFLLQEGNISLSMAWTQIGLALLVAGLAWLGAWRARSRWKRALRCRCLLCGEQWQQGLPEPFRR